VFKRLFWLMIGAGFGFGMSLWVLRVVRETVERYSPHRISSELTEAARDVGADVLQALVEGREAMRQHEAELRAQVSRRT
jgi:ATP-dependent RNA circularization protein (DNA/RNA ligase family)